MPYFFVSSDRLTLIMCLLYVSPGTLNLISALQKTLNIPNCVEFHFELRSEKNDLITELLMTRCAYDLWLSSLRQWLQVLIKCYIFINMNFDTRRTNIMKCINSLTVNDYIIALRLAFPSFLQH